MNIIEYAKTILEGHSLSDKLISTNNVTGPWDHWNATQYQLPNFPNRPEKLKFSSKKVKFPSKNRWHHKEIRGMAIHFFANHELLAIEMCASALLIYPHRNQLEERIKRDILNTLQDEQNHLKLYIQRMKELGVEFGDFPLNSFFWQKMHELKNLAQYFAVMSLTFESANLDFAQYYCKLFASLEDHASAQIMNVILQDEIKHVAFGRKWLNTWKKDLGLWDYYVNLLPFPITPARAKGIEFGFDPRRKAGLDEEFINKLHGFSDSYKVTQRKNWKKV